jgi:hypothetical protein
MVKPNRDEARSPSFKVHAFIRLNRRDFRWMFQLRMGPLILQTDPIQRWGWLIAPVI